MTLLEKMVPTVAEESLSLALKRGKFAREGLLEFRDVV